MISVIKNVIGLVAIATVAFGCSPIPDAKPPTEAEIVHYADHVIVAKVLELIVPDPVFGDMYGGGTYGARVQVRCTYKGGILGDTITIYGAGFVPGLCTAKPLVTGKVVLLFLDKEQPKNATLYTQTNPAESFSNITRFMDVCDLVMQYPHEGGFPLSRESCPEPVKKDCKRYSTETNNGASGPNPNSMDEDVPNVVVQFNQNDTSTTAKPDNSVTSVSASVVLMALCSILRQFV